ncbi:enoyl-CoA hydratase [Gordonia pseudamarae]|jgi:acyl dehydratase|uniref:Enoyl-CoA hydratase n=1 Tax=Gordonia pseudamarae TaxID=2831662 RepID=A0ABX6IDV6_9ACTN|nr:MULTISPECIES: MaoC/PaaZ C-terminal domain-containing protein [Gordonia]MBD0021599.1 MaoC family dehydratase N-terminal domain-containing protein [Gordonia sp. (in: high G+C Gram-positive bacteria)]QHN25120.1 enoyl-CoA hydratase [Gordonia pseudamarae]QHN34053.1 enoyl-CoA hydratase [Gordonia pseudamarae]
MIDHTKVGSPAANWERTWTTRDTMLYAVSVGAGAHDPTDELRFTTDNTSGITQQVLPTFVTVMAAGEAATQNPLTVLGDIAVTSIVHGGQRITLHNDIPPAGSVVSRGSIAAIYDKGRHAAIVLASTITDADDGTPYADIETTMILTGEGGFGGNPGPKASWSVPDREPDEIVTDHTRPEQALLYRLNSDRNPLHSDPAFAAFMGRTRPTLHGLCTYGYAGRAVLATVAESDPGRFGSFFARFAAPVEPGDELHTLIWRTENGALFQTKVGDTVVLDHGEFRLR